MVLVASRYLTGRTATEQLTWLLLCPLPDYLADVLGLEWLSPEELHHQIGPFNKEALSGEVNNLMFCFSP